MAAAFIAAIACIVAEAGIAIAAAPQAAPSAAQPPGVAAPVSGEAPAAPSAVAARTIVFADKTDAAVVDAVEAYLESIDTMRGEFVQTGPTGAVVNGDFALRRPGQIRFDYDDPSPLTIVATQGNVYVSDADLDQTDTYPLSKTPLKFLLARKIDLADAKLLGVERDESGVTLVYGSRNEEEAGDIAIRFAAPALEILGWEIRDPQNGVTLLELANAERGVRLDNRQFAAPDAGGRFINR